MPHVRARHPGAGSVKRPAGRQHWILRASHRRNLLGRTQAPIRQVRVGR